MVSELPVVAIIMLNWNRCEDTITCLTSLQNSRYPNCLIILVDNGSTDGTASRVRDLFPAVHVLENRRNLGYAEGNNVGIQYAMAKGVGYLYLLNNDTTIDATCVQRLVHASQRYPTAAALCPTVFWMSQPTKLQFAGATWSRDEGLFRFYGLSQPDRLSSYGEALESDILVGCALFCTAEAVSSVGLFDPRFYLLWEEYDWCARARSQGYSLLHVPQARIWHKGSASFSEGSRGVQYQYYYARNRLLWYEKNLQGMERWRATIRVLKELYWLTLDSKRAKGRLGDDVIWRGMLYGIRDYVTRSFGARVM